MIVAASCYGQSAVGAAVTAALFFLLMLVSVGNLVVTRYPLYIVLTASALSALLGTSSGVLITSVSVARPPYLNVIPCQGDELGCNWKQKHTPASGPSSSVLLSVPGCQALGKLALRSA